MVCPEPGFALQIYSFRPSLYVEPIDLGVVASSRVHFFGRIFPVLTTRHHLPPCLPAGYDGAHGNHDRQTFTGSQPPREGKGVRLNLPERPGGCFAQIVPAPFSRPVAKICITQMSAGSSTAPGGYGQPPSDEQFPVTDHRSVADVARWLADKGFCVAWDIRPVSV